MLGGLRTTVHRVGGAALARRGMATEAQLKMRIVGTTNISKITKSMKMVSAAKLRGDQTRLNDARPFGEWAAKVTGAKSDLEELPTDSFPQKNLLVICSTDKGLCGGVNTILGRMSRQLMANLDKDGKSYDLFVLGDKGRGQMRRAYGDKFVGTATERVMPYTFDLASAISKELLEGEYDSVHIVYNEFKSAIQYIPSIKSITPMVDPNDEFLHPYDVEPENDPETLTNFYEYTLATQLYHAMMENATSEQSSRMSAMENASKNAGEMIQKLTLQYNRARQARITTELIEIISGASALEG
jgi:F-type H+-transporting ATPase subunit gamma